jgi:F420-0:gamma-glutamyl ligase
MIQIEPVSTRIFNVSESVAEFVFEHLHAGQLKDGDILAVTSKIVSLAEGRLIAQRLVTKADLVRREADHYLVDTTYGTALTIKDGILLPAAGIDESNSADGAFILYPKNPVASAKALYEKLRSKFGYSNIGVIFTDSHTQPLRCGVTGIALASWGFHQTKKLIGQPDLFGEKFRKVGDLRLEA